MHKYDNQDHAMMTSMLCVRNIVAGERIYDVWRVNLDAEYHEQQGVETRDREAYLASGVRDVPRRKSPTAATRREGAVWPPAQRPEAPRPALNAVEAGRHAIE
jgi:hypothetical protein